MDFELVEKILKNTLKKLREVDFQLLEINVNEKTISHKLAEHLQREICDFSVDCEYNRHQGLVKKLDISYDDIDIEDIDAKTIYPDIVIHKRNTDDGNLLVIEIKKSSNSQSHDFDISKIKALTHEPYNYKFGLFLEINVSGGSDCLKWFKEGRLFKETTFENA